MIQSFPSPAYRHNPVNPDSDIIIIVVNSIHDIMIYFSPSACLTFLCLVQDNSPKNWRNEWMETN